MGKWMNVTRFPVGAALGADDISQWASRRLGGKSGVKKVGSIRTFSCKKCGEKTKRAKNSDRRFFRCICGVKGKNFANIDVWRPDYTRPQKHRNNNLSKAELRKQAKQAIKDFEAKVSPLKPPWDE